MPATKLIHIKDVSDRRFCCWHCFASVCIVYGDNINSSLPCPADFCIRKQFLVRAIPHMLEPHPLDRHRYVLARCCMIQTPQIFSNGRNLVGTLPACIRCATCTMPAMLAGAWGAPSTASSLPTHVHIVLSQGTGLAISSLLLRH